MSHPGTGLSASPGGRTLQFLPEGFGLPPLPYLVVLAAGTILVVRLLTREDPPVTAATVVGLTPWMVAGAALHSLFQLEAVPGILMPLLGTPAVYFATFVAAGATWIGALRREPNRVPRVLGIAGGVVALLATVAVFAVGGIVRPGPSLASVVIALALTGVCWTGLERAAPESVAATGSAGVFVVFAHALDGASTAIGTDVLGRGERTPLSAEILEFAASLPTADTLGAGWLFVLVKLGLAVAVVNLFAGYVREDPRQAYLLLAVIVAVGLGPGSQNVILFAVT
jgi:uncharacterized membrane protein